MARSSALTGATRLESRLPEMTDRNRLPISLSLRPATICTLHSEDAPAVDDFDGGFGGTVPEVLSGSIAWHCFEAFEVV